MSVKPLEGLDAYDIFFDKNDSNKNPESYPGFQHQYDSLYVIGIGYVVQDWHVNMSIRPS